MPLESLPLELLCHICHYDIFSYIAYQGCNTGIDLGVVRHDILVPRYYFWAQVSKLFSQVVRSAVAKHEYGRTLQVDVQSSLEAAVVLTERVLLECPCIEFLRISAAEFQHSDQPVFRPWPSDLLDRKLTILFIDFDSSMPQDWQWAWLGVLINCFHSILKEVVIPSDFNHFGLPVSVFDDDQSVVLAQMAPPVPITFKDCMLESRPQGDENEVEAPLVASLFPYLLLLRHPVTLQNCWSLRVMLGAADPAYCEYRCRGGSELWTDWRDDDLLSEQYGAHDKVALYSLLDPMELEELAFIGVHVPPSDWDVKRDD